MPLDVSLVGRTYPPTRPYEVSREKIREFAEAVGLDLPAYVDPAAARALGHPDVVAPPTFPIVVSNLGWHQVIDDKELGLDYDRVVHGSQRFAYTRPVYAGDRLVCVLTLDEVMERGGHGFLTMRGDLTAENGEHVVTVWTKFVVRGED
jgi:acyl dehydratase